LVHYRDEGEPPAARPIRCGRRRPGGDPEPAAGWCGARTPGAAVGILARAAPIRDHGAWGMGLQRESVGGHASVHRVD
jgi:hypothetical protein